MYLDARTVLSQVNPEDRIDPLSRRPPVLPDTRNIPPVPTDRTGNNTLMEIFIRVIARCVLSGFLRLSIARINLFDLNKDISVVHKDTIV